MGARTACRFISFHFASVSILTAALCGCALVDQFGGRASDYNFQTGDARNTTILMNIMRAAYSEPLAFTDISTVAGTATASGTASSAIPFPLNHPASIAAQTATVTPSATASATGTVNVANLDTQEFYSGLQTPLSMQQIAYYLTAKLNGADSSELLPLLISDIELTSTDGKTTILHNRADNPSSFYAFYFALNSLINNGLFVEQTKAGKAEPVGPLLSPNQARDPRLLAAIVSAASASSGGSSSSTSGGGTGTAGASGAGLTLKQVTKKVGSTTIVTGYQFEKGGSGGGKYRFCFATFNQPWRDVDFLRLSPPKADPIQVTLIVANRQAAVRVAIGKPYYCGSSTPSDQTGAGSKQKAGVGISITTRSLEGIFYYLGEMVRTELGIANGQATSLAIPSNNQQVQAGAGFNLFRIEQRLPRAGEPWAVYQGAVYSIPVDPSGLNDGSSRVLQIVSDLLALQSSAKNLPAPNLIAITTP